MIRDDDVIPQCPSDLCCTKEDFLDKDFTIESFIHSFKDRVSLDILRNDLGSYLKVLRSALIELINRDYGDFINLTTNLSGLDKRIQRFKEPLNGFRGEVAAV